ARHPRRRPGAPHSSPRVTSPVLDSVVIGAGSAGLAAAYWLQRCGLSFTVLEAGAAATGSWPAYYRSLTLFTPARHSALPGLPFPGDPERYPSRDDMAAYLQTYAGHFAFPVEAHAEVIDVRRQAGHFTVTMRDGRRWAARSVVAASGTFRRPHMPELPGMDSTLVKLLHSAQYRDPEPYAGRRVIVVGAGNSAAQIAAELGRVAQVTLAVRRPPRLFPQRPLGHDLTDWLSWSGIERVPVGRLGRVPDVQPVIAVPGLRSVLGGQNPDIRPMFKTFTAHGVRWPDGVTESVDTVIFATGYSWNAGYLPRMATDDHGEPRQRAGLSTGLPGLAFVGLPGQRTVASGTVRAAGPDAGAVVTSLSRWLEGHHARP
ncbi:NAD(P)/FAD-dependent oxidoreductase, partial [Deinococcus sp.]|uniref:flavin-containing monooxygenase n=1 Tax=Deinococcus sp. TaxID=47478 RepID=UPI002869E516